MNVQVQWSNHITIVMMLRALLVQVQLHEMYEYNFNQQMVDTISLWISWIINKTICITSFLSSTNFTSLSPANSYGLTHAIHRPTLIATPSFVGAFKWVGFADAKINYVENLFNNFPQWKPVNQSVWNVVICGVVCLASIWFQSMAVCDW